MLRASRSASRVSSSKPPFESGEAAHILDVPHVVDHKSQSCQILEVNMWAPVQPRRKNELHVGDANGGDASRAGKHSTVTSL